MFCELELRDKYGWNGVMKPDLKLPVMFLVQFYVRGHLVLLSVKMIPISL